MNVNDVILQTATKVLVFVILIFSVFMFFNGHHNPGGGFIGALMTSSSVALLMLAFDMDTINRILPFDYKILAASGLLIAILTGVGSFLFGAPFLSHTFDYFELPILGEVELATALLFDFGVYVVVVAITLIIIQTIGEDR